MCGYEDVRIELVDTPPVTADHVPGGLMGTIRSSDIIAIVVDAADQPLEQAEMVRVLLQDRGLVLRSVPQSQLDPADVNQHCAIVVCNKIDVAPPQTVTALAELYAPRLEVWPVSAATGQGLERLVHRLWQLLAVVRVYTKGPGRPADKGMPFTLEIGSTVEDLAREIHRELPQKMKFARVWGEGRFDGQHVHRTDVLHDKDVVEIHQ
jgi:hypothetical protein